MSRSFYFLVALAVFLLDRASKVFVEARLPLHQSQTIIPGFFDLAHTRNTGVAFGFLANSDAVWVPQVLTVISAVALLAILAFSLRNSSQNWKLQFGLMLVLGGAGGNLYDRLFHGYVTDFIEVYYRGYHWPTFNLADSSISIGIGLLLLETLTQRPYATQN
jgi:signal peptidase II